MSELVGLGLIAGLTGSALLAGLCALLFIEELGVPLPFAPGDLVLVLYGATVATDKLNPAIAGAAAAACVIAGALTGRELFASIGSGVVYRIADWLRIRNALERAAAVLRKHGWRAVLLGRLTPGLRVHTTEAAGLVAMPRTTFLIGLVPAVAIYQCIFMGLGFLIGPLALSQIHAYTPQPLPLVVMIAAVVGVIASARWLVSTLRRARLLESQ